jgi:hypothetical protein
MRTRKHEEEEEKLARISNVVPPRFVMLITFI